LLIDHKIFYSAFNAALDAGKEIMNVYNQGFKVDLKADGSPLTLADRLANEIILDALIQFRIPVISEEKPLPDYLERKAWEYFWLIDPLDGTKEFVNRNKEFTVNIALIYKSKPIAGIVTAPALNFGYMGFQNTGAFKIPDLKKAETLSEKDFSDPDEHFTRLNPELPDKHRILVASRSHNDDGNSEIISKLFGHQNDLQTIQAGSALKFGLLTEGKAHFYLRNDKIWEWDTAAGHAVLLAAGGDLFTWPDGSDLSYNKETLKNPGFVACASKEVSKLLKAKLSL
jgi:3'(2'), 5'-bisphosphate nucleotidase